MVSGSIRVGMIGFSDGDGHPFSFSAIINGYSDAGMTAAGWDGIHRYLSRRDPSEFGGLGMQVTHAWSQDKQVTQRLCDACLIPSAVSGPDPAAMLPEVDAVIIARDDAVSHMALSLPFLKAGLPVFVDKPLTLDLGELTAFRPYLESGQLMSCSGMRFAQELDEPRQYLSEYGEVKLIRGAILNDWARYGVHLIDATLNLTPARPVAVTPLPARHQSLAVELDDGSLFQVDALGSVGPCFRVDIFGSKRISTHAITDNFSMFRRLLYHFASSIGSGRPGVPASDMLASVRLLIAGERAMAEKRTVQLHELDV